MQVPDHIKKGNEEDIREDSRNVCRRCETMDAAQSWQHKCAAMGRESGFDIGEVSPCYFYLNGGRGAAPPTGVILRASVRRGGP